MTQAVINTGTFPNDATGDPALTAFTKINSNFTQLFGGTFTYPSMTIGPPASGVALTVNGGASAQALAVFSGTQQLISTQDTTNVAGGSPPNSKFSLPTYTVSAIIPF